MSEKKPDPKQPKITIPPDTPVSYANLVRITHSPSEFVFDFARMLPGLEAPEVLDRVLLNPLGAKLLYGALGENLAKYESKYGEITLPGSSSLAESLFRPSE